MCSIPGVAESTYKMCYRGELPALPHIKYKKLPCMYQNERYNEEEIPKRQYGLKRSTVPVPQPPKLPVPTKPRPKSGTKMSSCKDGTTKVLNTKFGPMDMATVNKLYNKYKYTTFTQNAAEEFVLPLQKPEAPKTTLEPKADMVRLRGQRYECNPEDWQDAVLWDRLQSRQPTNARPSSPCKENIRRRSQVENCLSLDRYRQNNIRKLVQTDGLADVFVRKCPGYAGYNPLCPPETKLNAKRNPPEMATLMSSSFRQLPDDVYRGQLFARQSPFSQTVTLTYPFNPFNKVGDEVSIMERTGLYSATGRFMGLIG